MKYPRDLGSAMKELRGKRTQKAVAKRAGIDPGTWCAYEKGVRWPRTHRRFETIAHGLQVQVSDLETLMFEHQRRRLEAKAPPPEATLLDTQVAGHGEAMNLLADERAKAYIGEAVSRITSDLLNLFAFVRVASQRQERS